MRQTAAELVAKARALELARISEIIGKKVETLEVVQTYPDKVVVEIHMGENKSCCEGSLFAVLKYFSAQLNTDLLDLHDKTFSSGCDTCEHGSDLGWEIWCRP